MEENTITDQSQMDLFLIILSNKEFLCLMLTLTMIYYIVAGIQYWTTNYLITVLSIDKTVATSLVAITSITAPISGVLVGGIATSYCGGYMTQKAQSVSLCAAYICMFCSLPIPWVSTKELFFTFVWLLLFFGGFIILVLICWMLSSVPHKQRGTANSIAQFCYNAFGYLPAPFIYGMISQFVDTQYKLGEGNNNMMQDNRKKYYNKVYSRLPMASVVYSSVLVIILFTCVYRSKYAVKNTIKS